jgi:hypothetical protein
LTVPARFLKRLSFFFSFFLNRINVAANGKASDAPPERFLFDQEARHVQFWDFIRDKDWDGVASMIDKKVLPHVHPLIYSSTHLLISVADWH